MSIPTLAEEVDRRGWRMFWIVCSRHGRSPVPIRSVLAAARERWWHEFRCHRGWPKWMTRAWERQNAEAAR